jgi:Peptidase A4 family
VLGLVAAALAATAVATASAASPRGTSDNWSGYAAFGPVFKSVSGSWVQPSAECFGRSTSSTEAAFWIGLGGNARTSDKVEQIGTEADCDSDGVPDYYAWYELWPADGHDLDLDILPGDRIIARVELARSSVRISIDDLTGGQSFAKTLPLRRPDGSSAEWIAEAPALTVRHVDQISPLTNFGTVRFSDAAATSLAGARGSISAPAWHESAIDFLSDRGNPDNPILSFLDGVAAARGFPSGLRRSGTAFSITWQRGLTPPPRGIAPAGAA